MSDAEVLLAEGRSVKLADGSERYLQFRNEQVLTLEKRYGGMRGYMQALRTFSMETIAQTFATLFGVAPQRGLELIDAKQMAKYVDAIADSLAEFFGLEYENCPSCQKTLTLTDAKFCPNCGVELPQKGEAESQETNGQLPGQNFSTGPWSPPESTRTASGSG